MIPPAASGALAPRAHALLSREAACYRVAFLGATLPERYRLRGAMPPTWMIYGANGYTARLIAEKAQRLGSKPVLAGRNAAKLETLGSRLGLETRVFGLESPEAIATHLDGISLVLNCAGPFSATFQPFLDACLLTRTHYLDITGEIAVFEALFRQQDRVAAAGITAVSGVGFDVVPTDCLAALLKQALPDASTLRLGLAGSTVLSPGTAKTVLEGLGQGGRVRRHGELVRVPLGTAGAWLPFRGPRSFGLLSPLADVSTAYHSTGIPNIEVYLEVPPAARWLGPLLGPGAGLLSLPPVKRLLEQLIVLAVKGPSEELRQSARMTVWGEVSNDAGKTVTMRLQVPEPYQLTVEAAYAAVERVMTGTVAPGAMTPSRAFGGDFVLSLPQVSLLGQG